MSVINALPKNQYADIDNNIKLFLFFLKNKENKSSIKIQKVGFIRNASILEVIKNIVFFQIQI